MTLRLWCTSRAHVCLTAGRVMLVADVSSLDGDGHPIQLKQVPLIPTKSHDSPLHPLARVYYTLWLGCITPFGWGVSHPLARVYHTLWLGCITPFG